MVNKSLDCLDKRFKALVENWLTKCKNNGIDIQIVETCRSIAVQTAYYAQGRQPLEEVNKLRQKAGLPPIKESENQIITWTMQSPHLYGFAIDFVPLVNGKPAWNAINLFEKAGQIAQSLGLVWGGSWKVKDYPHIEFPNWQKFAKIN